MRELREEEVPRIDPNHKWYLLVVYPCFGRIPPNVKWWAGIQLNRTTIVNKCHHHPVHLPPCHFIALQKQTLTIDLVNVLLKSALILIDSQKEPKPTFLKPVSKRLPDLTLLDIIFYQDISRVLATD